MRIEFRRGYNVFFKKGWNVTYVAPHAGPAFETVTSRDENTETVASLCWMRTGGKIIVSSLPRKRALGIDFNRGIPPKGLSIRLFQDFIVDSNTEMLFEFRKKYAWSAKDERDYQKRLKIYRSFWNEVKQGSFIVLIHRCFSRLKNVPTIMDISTFDGMGIERDVLKKAVEEVNRKNRDFFKKIEKEYKAVILLEEERIVQNLTRIFGEFPPNLNKIENEYVEHFVNDTKVMKKYCPVHVFRKLQESFTPRNFLYACKKALENVETPRITVEHIFKGSKSIGPRKQLLSKKRKVINIESMAFMNFWYPHKAAEMIVDIIEIIDGEALK